MDHSHLLGVKLCWEEHLFLEAAKRQASVSQSSCESEYYALSEVGVWLRLLLQELENISAVPTVI